MSSFFEQVVAHFAQSGIRSFGTDESEQTIAFRHIGTNGEWTGTAQVQDTPRRMVLISTCPIPIPEPVRLRMAELITRINFGLVLGNFELDLSSGVLRYKLGVAVDPEQAMSTEIFRTALFTNVSMMDKYYPALMQVGSGTAEPVEALRLLNEKSDDRA